MRNAHVLIAVSLAASIAGSGAGLAESIAGNWRTKSGEIARIAKCGGAWCITLATGKYKGRRIGRMSGSGSSYAGSITDPTNDRTYAGKASVDGASMSMRGCVLGGLFCRSQTWVRR